MLFTKNPFSDIYRFQNEINKMFQHFNTGNHVNNSSCLPVNIEGNDNELVVTLEVPGISTDNINLFVEKNKLNIQIVEQDKKQEGVTYYIQERTKGEWNRVIALPFELNEEKIDASYSKGVLRIHLQRKDAVAPKKIEIKKS